VKGNLVLYCLSHDFRYFLRPWFIFGRHSASYNFSSENYL